jgi:PAS domain-containing protein
MESYKPFILGGILVIVVAMFLVFELLRLRAWRKKFETDLVFANDRLRLVLEAGGSIGWDWDITTGREDWFGDLQTVFGIPSDTYSGLTEDFHQRVHAADRELVAQAVAGAKQDGKPYAGEFRVVRADGYQRPEARGIGSQRERGAVSPGRKHGPRADLDIGRGQALYIFQPAVAGIRRPVVRSGSGARLG